MNREELISFMHTKAKELILIDMIKPQTTYSEIETIFREQISDNANDIFIEMFFNICVEYLMSENILRESEDTIRENLYLSCEEYDDYWEEWKDDIIKTIRKYEDYFGDENFYNWSYCLESDFDHEQDFYNDDNIKLIKIANENGLIIYKKEQ